MYLGKYFSSFNFEKFLLTILYHQRWFFQAVNSTNLYQTVSDLVMVT